MKWIGQLIYDQIARFRNDIYLQNISSGTIASGGNLGLDSNNKIVKATITSGSGDIEGVTAGTGLSGGGTTGTVTLNVSGLTISEIAGGSLTTSSESFADNDTTLMTSAAINDRIESFGYTTNTGDITGVTAGTNLSGGGASGAVTINLADASTSAKGAASFSSDNFSVSSGDVTIKDGGVDLSAEVDGRLPVANGGTGASSLTDGGILLGSGTAAVTATAVLGDGEILIGDGTTDPVALDVGSSTAITTLGTVSTGVWNGTAIATDQQKHLAYFEFKGYGTGDGTNYEMPEQMTDANAPFEHNTSTGSDGLTAQTIQTVMRSGGVVMPYTGVLKKFHGWATSAGSGSVNIALFKFTPTDDTAGNLTPVQLVNESITASGNAIMNSFSETSSFDAGFTAGDIIYPAILGINTKAFYFNSTLVVEWS